MDLLDCMRLPDALSIGDAYHEAGKSRRLHPTAGEN
jgi:hypothetical protein